LPIKKNTVTNYLGQILMILAGNMAMSQMGFKTFGPLQVRLIFGIPEIDAWLGLC
jgi:catalase (peroxidase I)